MGPTLGTAKRLQKLRLRLRLRFLRRQTFAGDLVHDLAEAVELGERGINIGSDADSLEFFVNDRDGKDVVLVEEIFRDVVRFSAVDVNIGDRARLVRVEGSVELYLRNVLQLVHPIAR